MAAASSRSRNPSRSMFSTPPAYKRPRITGLRILPMRSISTSTTSPSCKKRGGVRLNPTPEGVPVAMISPGSSVIRELRNAIEVATEKILFAVLVLFREHKQQATDQSEILEKMRQVI